MGPSRHTRVLQPPSVSCCRAARFFLPACIRTGKFGGRASRSVQSGKPSSPERFRDFLPFLTRWRVWLEPCATHVCFLLPSLTQERELINKSKEGTTSPTSSSTSPLHRVNVPQEAALPGDRCAAQPGSFHPNLTAPALRGSPVLCRLAPPACTSTPVLNVHGCSGHARPCFPAKKAPLAHPNAPELRPVTTWQSLLNICPLRSA